MNMNTSFRHALAKAMNRRNDASVPILICTPDQRSPRFQATLQSVIETTSHIPIRILVNDNRGDKEFSHAADINAALDHFGGFLVALDDDVIVYDGWLDALLAAVAHDVAFVACSVRRQIGNRPVQDWCRAWCCNMQTGLPTRWWREIAEPTPVPAMGSCCMLHNLRARLELRRRMDYWHYYGDPALCFEAWEYGLKTITVPAQILHKNYYGQPSEYEDYGLFRSIGDALLARDRETFKRIWLDSGRLATLRCKYESAWPKGLPW